ncbi:MgtC/SapB family protein [Paludisphaera soli]|uniref:MgtC/SapB family protein n=1 Tax=Paludisphaera soli TaxID=2712865 RepID=UPI0013EDC89A|nr:MgtC/SapB family protein [Paludisphaera soli]
MTTWELLIRLTVAAALGGAVGLERHRADKAAGLRTHMLVGLGSALFMIVSTGGFEEVRGRHHVQLDPSRVASQVVTGIGFLGAGAILRRNEAVLGLTTAASVWTVAAVGLAAGGGLYLAAVATTVVALVVLTGLRWVEDRVGVRPFPRAISILVEDREAAARVVDSALVEPGLAVRDFRARADETGRGVRVVATLDRISDEGLLALAMRLQGTEGVLDVSYEGRTL